MIAPTIVAVSPVSVLEQIDRMARATLQQMIGPASGLTERDASSHPLMARVIPPRVPGHADQTASRLLAFKLLHSLEIVGDRTFDLHVLTAA